MKPKKIKARKFHSQNDASNTLYAIKERADKGIHYVLPADAASVEAMVEQANYGIIALTDTGKPWTSYDAARAALAAIGIKGGAK